MLSSAGYGVTDGRRLELAGDGEIRPKRSLARPSRFHDFFFPTMNWSGQRFLRGEKPISGGNGSGDRSTDPYTQIEPRGDRKASYFPVSALPMSSHTGGEKETEAEQDNAPSTAAEEAAAAPLARPWNLKKRRAACQALLENGRNKYNCSSPSNPPLGTSVMRNSAVGENGRRKKFSISLSRAEIEEDFLVFKGTKPSRRPKKRPKVIQRQLDDLFPGVWLSEINANMYKVD
ncbi:uncharacterized protein LOC110029418 isoform X1 [Phalaenopsis equestris]|uniref:uncharacterized protein LOC110029418 isoform X1 n=1 Tax=Phalaenopsis equestris TaxID=78828 RepID=UPI0009E2F025|nr:uncharacterized protein LOC110029418 isoform X1 [Phalaenopsis equestris]